MMTKTTVVSLFALSLLALTGIGYATFTSAVTINGTASAGNLNLQFYSFTNGVSSSGYGSCDWSANTGTTVTLTVSNLAPGDSCTAYSNIYDTGSLPTTSMSATIGGPWSNICLSGSQLNCFAVYDTYGINTPAGTLTSSTSGSPLIQAGGASSVAYNVEVVYVSGSTTQSLSGSFTITITGSVGS